MLIIGIPVAAQVHYQVHYFIPTSDVVRVASMAARDEGFNVSLGGNYLDELRTKDGKEPYPGYTSIGLYQDDHLVRSYSIRVKTGDLVDATRCELFRYPDLLKFKNKVMFSFGTQEVSLEQIASEIGCEKLVVVPQNISGRRKTKK